MYLTLLFKYFMTLAESRLCLPGLKTSERSSHKNVLEKERPYYKTQTIYSVQVTLLDDPALNRELTNCFRQKEKLTIVAYLRSIFFSENTDKLQVR